MPFDDPFRSGSVIEDAIDRHPLTVSPDALLVDVIVLMSQTRGGQCTLPDGHEPLEAISLREARSSGVLIMQNARLLGIFTERDIVQLIAAGVQFQGLSIGEVMIHPVITLPQTDFRDIFAALFLFRRHRIRHLVLVDTQGLLVGVVTPESIRRVLHPANLLKIRRVADVMTTQVIQTPLTASVLSLAQLMAQHRVSCVVLTEGTAELGRIPVGIVTERDIVQFQALELDLFKTQAQTVMSTPLFLLSPEDSLWLAHQEMQRRYVQRLVVSWDWGQGLGIVTQTSLLRVFDPVEMYGVIETLQRTIYELESRKMER
jgi:signal-transduction protein with cAMP-binding, CBS, and nucleotidyltransferase domain